MTAEELDDEIKAIDAIYPDSVITLGPQIYNFKIPNHEYLTVQFTFPDQYPEEIPQLIQIVNDHRSRFTDTAYLERNITEILNRIFVPDQVVLFELLTELQEFFDKYIDEHPERESTVPTPPPPPQPKVAVVEKPTKEYIDPTKDWTKSDPIVDKNSTFIGYARKVDTLEQAQEYLNELITDKKISRATHNISSWRIRTSQGVQYQDCDDDGETAAGGRLLHLLQMMDAWNVIVVVSRWFGGIHLGPDRFKHINSVARDVLIKGSYVSDTNNAKKKK
ncbi:Protein IMPACT [Spathaspora sp. JA1]|nr:Protein IMPACT [Spathaspora sp. JA1]